MIKNQEGKVGSHDDKEKGIKSKNINKFNNPATLKNSENLEYKKKWDEDN